MGERELLGKVIELRQIVLDIKETLENTKRDLSQAEDQLIEAMNAKDLQSFNVTGLGQVSLKKPRLYANFRKEFEERVLAFLDEQGRGDMVKPTVNRSEFSKFIAGCVAEGVELPEFITYYLEPSIQITQVVKNDAGQSPLPGGIQ